jgi:hypothetical protein
MSKGKLLTLWTATRPLIWVSLWEASASLSSFRLVSSSNESNTKIEWLLIECFDSILQLCFCLFRGYQSGNVIFDLILGQCSCCCLRFRFCPSSLEWFEFFLARAAAGSVAGMYEFMWKYMNLCELYYWILLGHHLGWALGRDLISYSADALFWGLRAYYKMPQPHTLVGNWHEWLNWHNHVSSVCLCKLSETQSRVHLAPIFFRPRRKKMCSEPCQWYKGLQSKLQRVKRWLHRIT